MNLQHRITIQKCVRVIGSDGIAEESWQHHATVWASIEPLRGREYLQSMTVNTEVSTRIRIRYQPDITSSMRVMYNARIYNILSVINLKERNRELELMCAEVIQNG